jgi:hypothetical protein
VEPIQSRFADSDVRIADLVSPEHPVLTEFSFSRCHVLGPAVLVPMGCSFVSCEWDAPGADWSTLFWEVDTQRRTVVVGAIALHNCTFDGCRLSGIGIAGPAALREQFLKDVGEAHEPY